MKQAYVGCLLLLSAFTVILSCHRVHPPQHDISDSQVSLNQHVQEDIGQMLDFMSTNAGTSSDSLAVFQPTALRMLYDQRENRPLWSDSGHLLPQADSMLACIRNAPYQGLSPNSYHARELDSLVESWQTDSLSRRDAISWAKADLFFSDAFIHLVHDIHYGVLPEDSLSLRREHAYSDSAVLALLHAAWQGDSLGRSLGDLAPQLSPYQNLLQANRLYRDHIALTAWDTLPEHDPDTLDFLVRLRRRLEAESYLTPRSERSLKEALQAFQRDHNLYPDGVVGKHTLDALNVPRSIRLQQLALNLNRWRQFPDTMPAEYLIVNLAAFHLYLYHHDTLVLSSRVIVGKPSTPSPQLNSYIYNFQLYPYWRVPFSIATKEMLPQIKRNIGYLTKNNLEVLDRHNQIVNPYAVTWNRFNRHYFPYRIRQMIGLDNSLGILKFNFPNKYSVYLHDTNARSFFNRNDRALSHGCIRVQQWDSLAHYLVRADTLRHLPDSLNSWLRNETQKFVALDHRLPLYIRYFTVEANQEGRPVFYNDGYHYDARALKTAEIRF